MKFSKITILFLSSMALVACGGTDNGEPTGTVESDEITVSDAELVGNPFMDEWDTPYGLPPFAAIEDAHYMPATKKGILEVRAEYDAPRFYLRGSGIPDCFIFPSALLSSASAAQSAGSMLSSPGSQKSSSG